MFKSLRSRLFLSYLATIFVTLTILGLFLLYFSVLILNRTRIEPIFAQLEAVNIDLNQRLANSPQFEQNGRLIQRHLNQTASDHNIRIFLLDHQQTIIFDSQNLNTGETFPPDYLQTIRQQTIDQILASRPNTTPPPNPRTQQGRLIATDNTRWIIRVQQLPIPALKTNTIIFANPEPSSLSLFRNAFVRPLCLSGFAALILATLFALLITRSVSRPLQQLDTASAAIARGHYDQQLTPTGPQEIRRVAHTFNHMITEVNATRQAQQDFLNNVAHDLKTPITAIRGWSQSILDGISSSPAEIETTATIIYDESERLHRLVNQLLDLARLESRHFQLHKTSIDLAALLQQLIATLHTTAQTKNITINLLPTPTLPPLQADGDRLAQIFTNLLSNALHHAPTNTTVTITITTTTTHLHTAIHNDGPPIPPEEQQRLFERFYQTDKARTNNARGPHGHGLGLAIAHQLTQAHHGTISLSSTPQTGTTFTVSLPRT
ncbi:MAG TPA: HAMP domain-containing sensor histidine kinase [Anaerolineae bacterium]|nr:HAMP domain-containing sensor histidine kinase [Anaerolineae bacterium]